MSGEAMPAKSHPFEFVLYEGNPDEMRTVVATPNETTPWIDPPSLKLRHRIGRGPFGDVWLATHHHSTEDYDEYHEVAIKMLNSMKEESMKIILDKLSDVFTKFESMSGVCRLLGFSVINGKVSIIMKFYDGSVGDKMAKLKGGKLPLPVVLRYGISLARAITEVHSIGYLVLNLKPSNFLLDENNQLILGGDAGVPFLVLGSPLLDFNMTYRFGTPNYMAPEQWEPEVRGPISFEADSWGYGCSILEMLTGSQPWSGKSAQEIYLSVVVNQERPQVPGGLPTTLSNVLSGCFEYDFRNRPLMKDIIKAFLSAQEEAASQEATLVPDNTLTTTRPARGGGGYTEWYLHKDHLQEGDIVRSLKASPNECRPKNMVIPEGKIVGFEDGDSHSDHVLVKVHGIHNPLRVHKSSLERVTSGFSAGDWVRLKEEQRNQNRHSPVGILHSIDRSGTTAMVGFIGLETLWKGKSSDLHMAEPCYVGQFVRLKPSIFSPRFDWPQKREWKRKGAWATGRISRILPNGCLVVKFPGRLAFGEKQRQFLADPAEVELVSFNTSPGIVKKYQHVENFHWAVRPLVIALGLFTAVKLGLFVGRKVRRSKSGRPVTDGGCNADGNAVSSKDVGAYQIGGSTGSNDSNASCLASSVMSMVQGKR